jgi:hypothetical protein
VHRRILLGAQTGFTAVGGFLVGRFHGFRSYAAKGFGSHIDLTKSHFASCRAGRPLVTLEDARSGTAS